MRSVILALALTMGAMVAVAAPVVKQTVALQGPEGQRAVIGAADLRAGPRVTVRAKMHDKAHTFEGAPLNDLFARIGAPRGPALRSDLSNVVIVTARDGYQAVFSLAETDPLLRTGVIILADRMDGAPIPDEDGPYQIVVQDDLRPMRSTRMVTRIEVRRLGKKRPPSQ